MQVDIEGVGLCKWGDFCVVHGDCVHAVEVQKDEDVVRIGVKTAEGLLKGLDLALFRGN